MADQFKKNIAQLKQFWIKQNSKQKKIYLAIFASVLIFSVLIAMSLSVRNNKLVTLYTGIDPAESAEIYKVLQEMPISVSLESNGDILVDPKEKDRLLLELSGLGYPKTAPSYDIFSSNSSFTTTEFEKKQFLLFQLQDRLEKTLMNIEGVKSAIVTLDVPQDSNYVWEDETQRNGSASVLLEMATNKTLSSGRITAIKNLVGSSVPKMNAADVTIVDALTSLELLSKDEIGNDSGFDLDRLDFEAMIEKKIVEKVLNILSIGYKPEDVRVSATVVIDYNKMITEQMEYAPGEDEQGVVYQRNESFAMDPSDIRAEGIVGEENNTDIPIYVDANNDGNPEYVYHTRNLDYFVSYMKQQIEKDKALLTSASLAITVNDPVLTEAKQASIIALASKATNVQLDNISVASLTIQEEVVAPPQEIEIEALWWKNPILWAIVGGLILLIIIIVIVILRIRKKRLNSLIDAETEAENSLTNIQKDTEEERRKLRDLVAAQNEKDNIVTEGVKEFASENPEITASLLRSWLKEDE